MPWEVRQGPMLAGYERHSQEGVPVEPAIPSHGSPHSLKHLTFTRHPPTNHIEMLGKDTVNGSDDLSPSPRLSVGCDRFNGAVGSASWPHL